MRWGVFGLRILVSWVPELLVGVDGASFYGDVFLSFFFAGPAPSLRVLVVLERIFSGLLPCHAGGCFCPACRRCAGAGANAGAARLT